MRKGKKRFDIKTLFEFLFSFCIVFCGQDTLIFGTNSNSLFKYSRLIIYVFILLAMAIYLLFVERKRKLANKANRRFFTIFTGLFVTAIVLPLLMFLDFGSYTHMYLQIGLLSILFIFASCIFEFKDIAKHISYLIVLISLISNLFFLFSYAFGTSSLGFLPKITNENGHEFYFAGLTNVSLQDKRNYAIFREPGVYAIYLCFSLAYLMFNANFKSKIRLVIHAAFLASLVLSLLNSRSTTGYFCLIIILIASIGRNFAKRTTKIIWISSLLLIGCVIFLVGALNFKTIFGKLFVANSSLSSRTLAPFYGLIIFLRSPLIGNGINGYVNLFSFVCQIEKPISNTDTFMTLFGSFGVFVGLAFTCGFYRGCGELIGESNLKNKFPSYLVLLALFLLCEAENVMFSALFHLLAIFPLYGFLSRIHKRIIIPTRIVT